ncbi:hypothetical protein V6N13_124128 [Hibiscus sabdariffa]
MLREDEPLTDLSLHATIWLSDGYTPPCILTFLPMRFAIEGIGKLFALTFVAIKSIVVVLGLSKQFEIVFAGSAVHFTRCELFDFFDHGYIELADIVVEHIDQIGCRNQLPHVDFEMNKESWIGYFGWFLLGIHLE